MHSYHSSLRKPFRGKTLYLSQNHLKNNHVNLYHTKKGDTSSRATNRHQIEEVIENRHLERWFLEIKIR